MFDTIVIGMGPAGLEAGIYLKRYGLNALVIGKDLGALALAKEIENYYALGKMSGKDLAVKGLKEATSNVYGNGHTSLFADVIDAIKNNRQPYVDAKAGRDALELVLAIYKSAAEGKPVKLPLKECSTLDFTGRFDNER